MILDACCGSRMFWFDRADSRSICVDKRRETLIADSRQGRRVVEVAPDVIANFMALPFCEASFSLVIFDPPHFARNGKKSWMTKKYGTLSGDWRNELRRGFRECFRVLKPEGTLILKWNENEVSVAEIIRLAPERPLIGNRYGRHFESHWIVFTKPNKSLEADGQKDGHRSA